MHDCHRYMIFRLFCDLNDIDDFIALSYWCTYYKVIEQFQSIGLLKRAKQFYVWHSFLLMCVAISDNNFVTESWWRLRKTTPLNQTWLLWSFLVPIIQSVLRIISFCTCADKKIWWKGNMILILLIMWLGKWRWHVLECVPVYVWREFVREGACVCARVCVCVGVDNMKEGKDPRQNKL